MRNTIIILIITTLLSCNQRSAEKNSNSNERIQELEMKVNQLIAVNHLLKSENDSLKEVSHYLLTNFENINNELSRFIASFAELKYLTSSKFRYLQNQVDDIYGENYRVEIYQSEIYRSVYVTRIEYYSEGIARITSSERININNLKNISDEDTNSLRFVEWTDFNQFKINIRERDFMIEILDPKKFLLTEK